METPHMPRLVLALSISEEFGFAPMEDTLEGLCMLSRAFTSHWGDEQV